MRHRRVDLPVPVGPTIKTNSPGSIRRETRRRALTPFEKTLVTSSNWTIRCSEEGDDDWYIVETSWVRFATARSFPFRQPAPATSPPAYRHCLEPSGRIELRGPQCLSGLHVRFQERRTANARSSVMSSVMGVTEIWFEASAHVSIPSISSCVDGSPMSH